MLFEYYIIKAFLSEIVGLEKNIFWRKKFLQDPKKRSSEFPSLSVDFEDQKEDFWFAEHGNSY